MAKSFSVWLLLLSIPLAIAQDAVTLEGAARAGDKTALAQLKTLSDKGDGMAEFILGEIYGHLAMVGDKAALVQLTELAEKGNSWAQVYLSSMYREGKGVTKDLVEAANWTRKAAERGNADAQTVCGSLYERGEGVPKDYVVAYMWYNLAAAHGNSLAQLVRDRLDQQMTPAQIAEAQKMSREWKPKH